MAQSSHMLQLCISRTQKNHFISPTLVCFSALFCVFLHHLVVIIFLCLYHIAALMWCVGGRAPPPSTVGTHAMLRVSWFHAVMALECTILFTYIPSRVCWCIHLNYNYECNKQFHAHQFWASSLKHITARTHHQGKRWGMKSSTKQPQNYFPHQVMILFDCSPPPHAAIPLYKSIMWLSKSYPLWLSTN